MAFTCGFYNSKNHDRRYDARQLSSIFDGVILDGVYMSIGDRFMVKANGTDMMITVGTGRAWFNHTWSLNDAPYPIEVPQSEVILKRIDAVVLEINEETAVRANRIFILKGVPSSQPVRPTLENTNSLHQYALAYINVDANATLIRQADITYVVGQTPTPFVTSPLEGMNIDDLVSQWQDQWTKFFSDETKRWENFYTTQTAEMLKTASDWETLWETWFNDYTTSNTQDIANWKRLTKAEFMEWWNELQVMLDGDVAGNLSTAVIALQKKVTGLETFRHDLLYDKAIYDPILDSDGEPVLDSDGNPVGGRVIFVTEPELKNESGKIMLDVKNLEQYLDNKIMDLLIKHLSDADRLQRLVVGDMKAGGLYGGNYHIFDSGTKDLNNPPNATILQTTVSPIGLPPGLNSNGCLVIQHNPGDTYSAQLAFSFVENKIAFRRRFNSETWTSWTYLTLS